MGLIPPGQPNEQFIFSIPVPSSFANLPRPRFPSDDHVRAARELERSFVQLSGLTPGRYHTLDANIFESVKRVYDHLINALLEHLDGADVANLCVALYTRLEQFLGYMNKRRYERIPQLMLAGYSESTNHLDAEWLEISPYTESIKWLIEICLKICEPTDVAVNDSQIDHLLELTRIILAWDTGWDQIHHGVLPYEFVISEDFTASSRPTPQGRYAVQNYLRATSTWQLESEREWMDIALARRSNVDIDENEWFQELDAPMTTELGYSMSDWLRYYRALIESFDYHEYIRVISKQELSEHLSRQWKIEQAQFDSLITDHALSRDTVLRDSLDALRPGALAKRDSRLFRRPVILSQHREASPLCIYGIETVSASAMRFVGNFVGGQFRIQRLTEDGPVMRTIGGIQTNLGNVFRDRIAAESKHQKLDTVKEKRSIGVEQIPGGAGFGPVDVFVVDRRFKRFVLVEAKDTEDPRLTPNKNWAELQKFQTHMRKLHAQTNWFKNRVNSLKIECGINGEEVYEVVGVIVINQPRLWMFTSSEEYPIVTDRDFFKLLKSGGDFVTSPQ